MNEEERTAPMPENNGIPDPVPGEDSPRPAAPVPEPETEAGEMETDAALRRELEEARSRLTQLERERELLRQGVPEEDLDYYVFRIGKLVTDEKDFRTAAGEYLKQNRIIILKIIQRTRQKLFRLIIYLQARKIL